MDESLFCHKPKVATIKKKKHITLNNEFHITVPSYYPGDVGFWNGGYLSVTSDGIHGNSSPP